jgi:hypothetical protein
MTMTMLPGEPMMTRDKAAAMIAGILDRAGFGRKFVDPYHHYGYRPPTAGDIKKLLDEHWSKLSTCAHVIRAGRDEGYSFDAWM